MITDEAKRFRAFRKKIKMSQVELSEYLTKKKGLKKSSQSDISKYELGDYSIPVEIVKAFYLDFKLSYEWFYHGVGTMIIKEPIKKTVTTDLKDILLTLDLIKNKLDKHDSVIKKLVRDVYDKES